jgi:hypothetical protein
LDFSGTEELSHDDQSRLLRGIENSRGRVKRASSHDQRPEADQLGTKKTDVRFLGRTIGLRPLTQFLPSAPLVSLKFRSLRAGIYRFLSTSAS